MRLAQIRSALRAVDVFSRNVAWFPQEDNTLKHMKAVLAGLIAATGREVPDEGEDDTPTATAEVTYRKNISRRRCLTLTS